MKKTTSIVLTIVSGLSFKASIAQEIQQQDYTFVPDSNTVNVNYQNLDSLLYCQTPPVEYTYYFHVHFFNNIFHYCFPRRYFYLTHPHFHNVRNQHFYYGPHHVTGAYGHRLASTTTNNSPRGGFGHYGTTHSIAA
jgi:hypothetical protein